MASQSLHFSFNKHKNDRVSILHHGKTVTMLSGQEAIKFPDQIIDADSNKQQLVMAKVTGNFKRGDERQMKTGKVSGSSS